MIIDLRCTEQYLSEKQIERWKERNILYNTVWFAHKCAQKEIKGPHLEYSVAAIKEYKKLKCYTEWDDTIKGDRSMLKPPSFDYPICADVMTGWWNPLKYFLKLENLKEMKNVHVREKYIEKLLVILRKGNLEKNEGNEEVAKKMAERFDRDKGACEKCLEFLEVVYTGGNVIPIITNYCSGSSLDGWDTKMSGLISPRTNQEKKWRKYAEEVFKTVDEFIVQNKLEHYLRGNLSDKKVDLFWNRKFKFKEATDKEWKGYFENVERKICYRNELLNGDEN